MRLPEEKIKAAILHPDPEVRLTAVRYFSESYADDVSVMPVVFAAIEKYGKTFAYDLLASADNLRQTPATVDWLVNQLRQEFNRDVMEEDNLRFKIALVLLEADPELLAPRHDQIMSLPSFPVQLKELLDQSLGLHASSWIKLWAEFEELGRKVMANGQANRTDNRRFHQIVKALARHKNEGADQVLSLVSRQYKGYDKALMAWLEPRIVELAGRMRLEQAIPLILDRLDLNEDYEALQERIGPALASIGGDAVIEALSKTWKRADIDSQLFLIHPFESIHTDLTLEQVLSYLSRAKDTELRSALAYAAVGHIAGESIEPVRRVLLEDGDGGDYWDLRYRLIATTTLLGGSFPEYDEWHQEAVETNYGFEKIKDRIEPFWIVDGFR